VLERIPGAAAVHQLDAAAVVLEQRRETAPDPHVDAHPRLHRVDLVHPLALAITFLLLFSAFESARDALVLLVNAPFALVGGVLALAAAILRSRLWDIDLLINRTLVYIPLTAILAGIFSASITLTQKFFVAITGQTSDAATVFTTLVIVAAIEPLKSGLQHLVDRRFKEASDPTRQLKAYHEQVRSFVQMMDPEQNARELLDETVRAFDATSGAVYLQRNGELQLIQTVGQWNDESKISIPLESNGARLGLLKLGARRNNADYNAQDRATLQASSELVACALALTERMNGVRQ